MKIEVYNKEGDIYIYIKGLGRLGNISRGVGERDKGDGGRE
jgi:hypothetical protein